LLAGLPGLEEEAQKVVVRMRHVVVLDMGVFASHIKASTGAVEQVSGFAGFGWKRLKKWWCE